MNEEINKTRKRLELLEELDLLEAEFGLIKVEYEQRKQHLHKKLKELDNSSIQNNQI